MARSEPSYWVKWATGIAGSVLGAFLIVNFVDDDQEADKVELVVYHAKSRAFSFKYPAYLGQVKSHESDTAVSVIAGEADPDIFDIFFGDYGKISIWLSPKEIVWMFPSDEASDSSHQDASYFDDAKEISRRYSGSKEELPFELYEELKDVETEIIRVQYLFLGKFSVLMATGLFSSSQWERYSKSIRAAFKTIKVDEPAARWWFRREGWLTIAFTKEVDGRRRALCSPTVWSQKRFEAAGCEKSKDYDALRILEFRCPHKTESVMRLIRSRADCDKVQKQLDKNMNTGDASIEDPTEPIAEPR